MKAIAFIPEIKSRIRVKRELCPGLFLLPESDDDVKDFNKNVGDNGHTLEKGIYLYFDGILKEDGTLYEIFQSYSLALTFYYEGLATCRAYKEIGDKSEVEFFIDENDKFGYDEQDERELNLKDIKKISVFYNKISNDLFSKKFNPVVNSLEFFNRFLKEREIKPRLLYLNICLESIFLAGSETEGISYKLGLRCSNLLYNNDNSLDKHDTYIEVKNGYDLRSKIIHGGDYDKISQDIIKKKKVSNTQRTELDHVIVLEKIVKRVFKIILDDESLYKLSKEGRLGGEIDKIFILV